MLIARRSVPVLLTAFLLCGVANGDVPPLGTEELARGPYSTMRALIERSIFKVDVVSITIRFGPRDRDRLAALARNRTYSDELGDRIARTAAEARNALAQVEFERSVSFDAWLEDVRKNLGLARDARYIDDEAYQRAYREVPRYFASARERGFRKGDRIIYRVRPASLQTVLVTGEGRLLVNQVDRGALPSRILLAGFFAPGIEPRELLVKSLFVR